MEKEFRINLPRILKVYMPLPNPACAIGILPNARDLRPRTIILASVAVHGTVSGPTSEIQLERGGASCLDYDFQEVQ